MTLLKKFVAVATFPLTLTMIFAMKEHNTMLRKVAGELLSVKRMGHLANIFNTTIKSDLGYDEAAIFMLEAENNVLRNLLHTDAGSHGFSWFQDVVQLKELRIDEILLADNQDLDGFGEFRIGDEWQHAIFSKYLSNAPPAGSRLMVFPMREGNDFTGNLFLLFDDSHGNAPHGNAPHGNAPHGNAELLKLLVVNINMALIHVLAEERMSVLGNNGRLLHLLHVSNALSGVGDLESLNRIVAEMLLGVFDAESCRVVLPNHHGTARSLLLSTATGAANGIPEDIYAGAFTEEDYFYRNVEAGEKLTVYNMDSLANVTTRPSYLQTEIKNGVRQKLAYPIYNEKGRGGCIFFNRTRNNVPADLDTPALQLVLSQLSKAILRIIDQDQLHRRLAQQDMLIALGAQIASVRSNEELLEIIHQNLREVIGFTHTIMAAVDGNLSTTSAYLLDPHAVSRQHTEYLRQISGSHTINDGFMDKVLASEEPLTFNLEKLIAVRALPIYLKVNYDRGIRQVIMTKFSKGSEVFGFWILTFDHSYAIAANTLQMVRDVAKQLSVSVQNIMVSQEYERREKERSRLMQFSNAVASIRDKSKLAKTIKEHLRDLFDIEDFVLWSLSKDHSYRLPVLFDEDSAFARHRGFQDAPESQFKNEDGIYNIILAGSGVSYFDAGDMEAAYSAHPFFAEIIAATDLTAMGGSVLRVGDEIIGLLTFSSHHIHLVREREELYLSICSQLAIVASNMFATDKISEQLAEISTFKERLEDEKIYLQGELETSANNSDMIGTNPGIRAIHKLIQQVAYTDSTVLILGETGTGKELVARSVHNNSPRKSKLMVKVNCAALPANLIESELFGHERGSFTGASERRLGKFELANHGTLFLDEIGEMPLDLQGKLLRALQEKEIERIGGKAVIKVDVRVIAATNRNLEKEVAMGKFRSDLYYRINIFPIRLPALRDRISDIPLLASHFISKYAAKAGKEIRSLSGNVLRELQRYNWPGNIRELEHIIERSVLLTKGDTLNTVDIPVTDSDMHDESMYLEKKIKTIDENERDHIIRIIKKCRGRINGQNGAAVLLGIPPSTLNSKMKRLDIRKQDMRP